MRQHVNRISAILAVALLALLPAVAVLAMDDGMKTKEEVTLTGQLSNDEQGGFVLIERESGDSIALESAMDLAAYVDSTVNVTGTWNQDAAGNLTFQVSHVEPAS